MQCRRAYTYNITFGRRYKEGLTANKAVILNARRQRTRTARVMTKITVRFKEAN